MPISHAEDSFPFGRGGRFHRGNMHTHSTNSDGVHPPEKVCAAYREAGYDFLVLSDHFMEDYRYPVTDTRPYRTRDFTTILGAELHAPKTELGELWHIKAVGLPPDFEPNRPGESGPEVAARAYAAGAFIGIVHPSWYGLTRKDAEAVPFAHAVEIYNHGSAVEVDRGHDWPYLDALLNEGHRMSGYASDDAHYLTHDFLGGWVMVQADERDPDALLASLKAGRYYSSQGPEIRDIEIDGDEVVVRCSPARAISVVGRGSKSQSEVGEGLEQARLRIKRFNGSWFRVTVIDNDGKKAWSNPIWLD
jgi:hypothetical protein